MERKKVKYYSQNGEDYLIWNLFNYMETGFFVEVGAFDGKHFSNTYSFEMNGWKGICIEPHPKFFPMCEKNRTNSICLNVACVKDDDIKEVDFLAEEIGLLSGISADEDDVSYRYSRRKLNFSGFDKIKVKAQTLSHILKTYAPTEAIDFISIDVEGTELDVLKGFDWKKYSPRVIIVEVNSEDQGNAVSQLLENENKYKFVRKIGANAFYALSDDDKEKLLSVNLNNCILTETDHPLGKEYTTRPHHNIRSKLVSILRRVFSKTNK